MLEKITLDGSNVSAEVDAFLHYYEYGHDGVYKYGQKLKASIVTNNLIKILDGLITMQGRFMRIVPGSYEEINIENGITGTNRIDLIVAHFETDGIQEKMDIRVLKGTNGGSFPNHTTGNTFEGDTVNELPLYAIHINGINIERIEKKFDYIMSRKEKEAALTDVVNACALFTTKPTGLLNKLDPNKEDI